jgi:hypothetical protein
MKDAIEVLFQNMPRKTGKNVGKSAWVTDDPAKIHIGHCTGVLINP